VQCAGYRIVQEALSNFIKHAPAANAIVALHRTPGAVIVEVQDDGEARAQPMRVGSGIRGMRERASAVGGSLEVGALPDGGWAVKATLPIARAPA
jgi:signal transduction histidine kinase